MSESLVFWLLKNLHRLRVSERSVLSWFGFVELDDWWHRSDTTDGWYNSNPPHSVRHGIANRSYGGNLHPYSLASLRASETELDSRSQDLSLAVNIDQDMKRFFMTHVYAKPVPPPRPMTVLVLEWSLSE